MTIFPDTLAAPSPADVATAFLTPGRPARPPSRLPADGNALSFDTRAGRMAATRWRTTRPGRGAAPLILLVHGWEGAADDFAAMLPPMRDAGFDVVALDLPAHGASEGTQTSIPKSARTVFDVAGELGPLHAVVAHSIGCPVTVEALAAGLVATRVVLLSAPASYQNYAQAFGRQAGLDAAGVAQMVEILLERGVDVAAVSTPARARELDLPALFVHSADDRIVPIADGRDNAAAWRGPATLIQVEGLGHRRLLADAGVISAVTRFLA